jgi:hypothetical protein
MLQAPRTPSAPLRASARTLAPPTLRRKALGIAVPPGDATVSAPSAPGILPDARASPTPWERRRLWLLGEERKAHPSHRIVLVRVDEDDRLPRAESEAALEHGNGGERGDEPRHHVIGSVTR